MSDESRRTLSAAPPTRASMRSERGKAAAPSVEQGSGFELDWRFGDSPPQRASMNTLAAALVGGGLGVMVAAAVSALTNGTSGLGSTAALWTGMLGAVIFSIVVQRTPGLFQLRFSDLVWGIGGATLLRTVAGRISGAADAPFPTTNGVTVSLSSWALQEGLPAGLIGPVIEETFFRAVLLVAVYRLLRPRAGATTAGAASALISAGLFVLLHAAFAPLHLSDSTQLLTMGLLCSLLVLSTGRIWGALLLHITYNTSFLLLAVAGSLLA